MHIRNRYNKKGDMITLQQIETNPPKFPALIELLNELYSQNKISTKK